MIGLRRRGVEAHRRATGFAPSDIAGLGLWLEADRITGKSDGDSISQWDDASGNARHATQATGSLQPTYRTNVLNGKPSVRFDGTDDLLAANGAATLLSGAVDWTVFVVCTYRNAGLDDAVFAVGLSSNNTPLTMIVSDPTGTPTYRLLHRIVGSTTDIMLNNAITQTATMVVVKRATTSVTLWGNGDLVGGVGRTHTVDRLAVGAVLRAAASNHANVDVHAVLVYGSALSETDRFLVEDYLGVKYGFGAIEADDSQTAAWLHSHEAIASTPIVTAAQIAGATELREQDSIIHDPNDPNLGSHPDREWKFYFSADVAGAKRLYVVFSADGETFGSPQVCTMGGSNRQSEDPSIVQLLNTRGQAHRDGSGKLHMYCEDPGTAAIYVYESTDGISWTEMASNPAIAKGGVGTWDNNLVGSPGARHDGTNYIVIYEGIITLGGSECMGVAYGTTPNGLTKSANNPVWDPAVDPHANNSIVADALFKNDAGNKIVLFAHSGTGVGTPTVFRGVTTNMDPTTWVSGDIVTVGGNLSTIRNDLTLDNSTGDTTQVVIGAEDDQSIVRYKLWGPL